VNINVPQQPKTNVKIPAINAVEVPDLKLPEPIKTDINIPIVLDNIIPTKIDYMQFEINAPDTEAWVEKIMAMIL
jgi:hypothetical protein